MSLNEAKSETTAENNLPDDIPQSFTDALPLPASASEISRTITDSSVLMANNQIIASDSAGIDAETAANAGTVPKTETDATESNAAADSSVVMAKNQIIASNSGGIDAEAAANAGTAPKTETDATKSNAAETSAVESPAKTKPMTWVDPNNRANFIPPGFMSKEEYDKKRQNFEVDQRKTTIEPKKVVFSINSACLVGEHMFSLRRK